MRPAWIAELEDDIAVAIVTKPTRQQIGCTQRQQQIAATERRQSKENDNLVSLGQHRLLDSTRSFSNGCQTNAQALSRCPNGSAVEYDPISLCSLNVVMGKWRAQPFSYNPPVGAVATAKRLFIGIISSRSSYPTIRLERPLPRRRLCNGALSDFRLLLDLRKTRYCSIQVSLHPVRQL